MGAGAVREAVEASPGDGNSRRFMPTVRWHFAEPFVEIVGVANFDLNPPSVTALTKLMGRSLAADRIRCSSERRIGWGDGDHYWVCSEGDSCPTLAGELLTSAW